MPQTKGTPMPMHDWTRLGPSDYHGFHLLWLAALKSALNTGPLRPDHFALADYTLPPVPSERRTHALRDHRSLTVPATEPAGPVGRRRVAIHHTQGRRRVAVIEIVSPSNKAKKSEFADLVGKSVRLLRQGVHVLLIDPFPPTNRDPNGIHAAVWKHLTGQPFTPPPGKPLTLASYAARGDDTYTAFVEPIAVGDTLPNMPLFLTNRVHVPVPLEETYRAAWQGYPLPLRAVLERNAVVGIAP